jgi:putative addiction module killer protein
MLAIFIGLQWGCCIKLFKPRVPLDRLAHKDASDAAPVGQAISELRIHYGPGYRNYFHRQGNTVVILLCGGDKASQAKDIKMAKRLLFARATLSVAQRTGRSDAEDDDRGDEGTGD